MTVQTIFMNRNRFFIAVAILLCFPAVTFAWEENAEITALFKQSHIEGTFVFYDVTGNKLIGHNRSRADTRYTPASTFKIANSLIGLSTGAVKSVDDILPYKGPAEPFIPEWAHDMGLREAIKISNVPIYQELARRIGLQRMRKELIKLHYGNSQTGDIVDRFWLEGPLKISAIEQTTFLSKLAQKDLPLPKHVQESVQDIILLEQGTDWKLYGKTGWQNAPGRGIGWWIGWVEKRGHIYVFALNIDIDKPSDAVERIRLGKACLEILGLL